MARCVLNTWQVFYRNIQEPEEAPGLILTQEDRESKKPESEKNSFFTDFSGFPGFFGNI